MCHRSPEIAGHPPAAQAAEQSWGENGALPPIPCSGFPRAGSPWALGCLGAFVPT